ncbi:MAG: LysM peptidoglycan-binding domain-containing protein [Chloroflexi bacterium]|nr:LysM peptidoglycan-binding domain-containing protein [Chloroflexota bacterium]
MKRLFILAAFVVVALAASACTRDKPPEPTPVPPTRVSAAPTAAPGTATAREGEGTVTPTLVIPITETPILPPPPPTSVVTVTATIPAATPTPLPSSGSGPTTYTVQWGDWLSKIAQKFGVTNQEILTANPGLNPNRIYPGQVLNIPAAGGSVPAPASALTPTPVAGATPTPVPVSPAGGPTTYTVQRGDWLYSIARKFGVTVSGLLAANPGINANFVYPGQVLNIPGSAGPNPAPLPQPGGNTYTVQVGDTLFSIAARFNVTTYALQIANHLPNPNFIYPGQTLVIPR